MKNENPSNANKFLKAFKTVYLKIAQLIYDEDSQIKKVNLNKLSDIERKAKSYVFATISRVLAEKRKMPDLESFFSTISMFNNLQPNQLFEERISAILTETELFTNNQDFDVGLIGKAYESLLPQKLISKNNTLSLSPANSSRKSNGAYYTPSEIVEYIIERTFGTIISETEKTDDILLLRILDPASGCGQFILGAIDFVTAKFGKKLSPENLSEFLKKFAEKCLYAVDLDSEAIDLCKISVWLRTGGVNSNHFVCANSLALPETKENSAFLRKQNFICWQAVFPEVFANLDSGFDIVLGNPPYISFSGRHAEKLDIQMKNQFHRSFDTKGWLTTHSMFAELAVKHLSKRFVSFVVPSQVAHLAGYAGLRATINKYSNLIDIKHWGENVFQEACTPAMTFIADSENCSNKLNAFSISWDSNSKHLLIEKLKQGCFSLGKLVADPGVHTGNCSRKLIKSSPDECENGVPVLEGKQLKRYQCNLPAKFLDLGYEKETGEYFSIRKQEKYVQAEFLIRQTADAPIVAPRSHAVYFRNSALALYPPASDYDVKYLVGVLNSKLMRFFYRQIVTEAHQRTFPQVKVGNLRKLPIKNIDFTNKNSKKLHDKICSSVKKIMNTCNQDDFQLLDHSIDKLVYELYTLDTSETKMIEESN